MIIEKDNEGDIWGRVTVNDNLMTGAAATLDKLKKSMKEAAKHFEGVEITEFEIEEESSRH